LQRCWAHLIRESKDLAEKFEEAIPLHDELKELYELLSRALENDTNNRAERALRPQVVLRKILGMLRNDRGTLINERIKTMLAAWGQMGLDSLQC
jgi:hypothetical protein